ncbi:MAG: hypothetical protein V4651_08425 [Bacteroidota bacterium]
MTRITITLHEQTQVDQFMNFCKEQHIEAQIEDDIITTSDDVIIAREQLNEYRRNPKSVISFDELKTLFKNSD